LKQSVAEHVLTIQIAESSATFKHIPTHQTHTADTQRFNGKCYGQ